MELQNLATGVDGTIVFDLLGGSGEFNAFTLSIVVRRNGNAAFNQRDLYWITTQGADSSITALSTQSGSLGGVAYTLSVSGSDLVFSHSEPGNTVDVVAGISGLRKVAP